MAAPITHPEAWGAEAWGLPTSGLLGISLLPLIGGHGGWLLPSPMVSLAP